MLYVQTTSNIVFPLSFLCDLTKIDDDLCCCETWMVALNCEMYLWYIQNLQNTVVHRIKRKSLAYHFGDFWTAPSLKYRFAFTFDAQP